MRFKQLREEEGYTIREFEKLIGINKSTLSRIETGNIKITTEHIEKYIDFFDVSVAYLLGKSEIRNEKAFTNMIKETLIEYGFANKPLNEIKNVLEKTLELYESIKKEH